MIASSASFGILNYTILFVYLAAMVGVGCRFAGKQKTTEDYFLAGRNMPWLVVGMSMFVSLTSAVSYLGIPGLAYQENVSMVIIGFVSLLVLPCLILVFYPFYRALHVTTSYEYILKRFGQPARFTVSALFLAMRLGWLGTVIYAPAMALSVVTGIPLAFAILLMGVLATTYTLLGGLSAVLWTDLAQFIILVLGAIWVALNLCQAVPGGASAIFQIASETDHLRLSDLRFSLFEMSIIGAGISYFFQMMQDFGTDQMTIQRLMSIPTYGGMARAAIFNAFCILFIVSLLLFIGLSLFAYYASFPDQLAEGITGDRVLPFYIINALPAGVSGLLITAIFAAAMSSMDSGINSISTVVVCDIIRPLRKKSRSDQYDVSVARWLTLATGTFATVIAFYVSGIEQILKASSTFLGLFGAPVLALFLMGMFTCSANFAGWLVGVCVAIPATIWLQHETQVHFIHYFPFCFGTCLGIAYPASRLIGFFGGGSIASRELTIWGRTRGDPE